MTQAIDRQKLLDFLDGLGVDRRTFQTAYIGKRHITIQEADYDVWPPETRQYRIGILGDIDQSLRSDQGDQ